MDTDQPRIVVLGGPNGAGKSTAAPWLLRDAFGVDEFVNADVIARGLSGFAPDRVAMAAGRIMLHRLDELASARVSFAFETTLASRLFASWLQDCAARGFSIHVVYLWLPNAEMAISRVASRVREGGHNVPEAVIRRRYAAGLRNFFELYRPLASSWWVIDNSSGTPAVVIAHGSRGEGEVILDARTWDRIREEHDV